MKVPKDLEYSLTQNSSGLILTESKHRYKAQKKKNLIKYRCVLGRQIPELDLPFLVKMFLDAKQSYHAFIKRLST